MSGWTAPVRGLRVPGLTVLIDDRPCCLEDYDGWHCTRDRGHAGRHLASMAHGTRIVAAWPGDHEPTAADLEAVPS